MSAQDESYIILDINTLLPYIVSNVAIHYYSDTSEQIVNRTGPII